MCKAQHMDQPEVEQMLHLDAEHHGCRSLASEMSNSLSDADDYLWDEQLFGCGKCLKYFKQSDKAKTYFYNHTRICRLTTKHMSHWCIDTGEKPFKCKVCDMGFRQNFKLTAHMRTHIGESPFMCDKCVKAFNQINHLKVNKRTHTGEHPY